MAFRILFRTGSGSAPTGELIDVGEPIWDPVNIRLGIGNGNQTPIWFPIVSNLGIIPAPEVIPTTGQTFQLLSVYNYQSLNPAATLAALTLTLPASPVNSFVYHISTTQAITALTVNGGTNSAPTSMSANTAFALIYLSSASAWRRI